jgi:RNA polymerase primary sigma factor
MMLDAMTAAIKKLIARGKERGRVTVDELNAALPAEQVSSEMVEYTMAMLNDIGINVVERGDPEDGDAAVAGPRKPLSPLPLRSGAEAPLDGSEGGYIDATNRAR